MSAHKTKVLNVWNTLSIPMLTMVTVLLISTDRRPDDTSIQVALAAGTLGLFAVTDIFVNRIWLKPRLFDAGWLLTSSVVYFITLCTLSASWASEWLRTLEVMAVTWALFVAWFTLRFWADRQHHSKVRTLLRWVCVSILAFAVLLFWEVVSNQSIHHFLVNSAGMSMSIPNYYSISGGSINVLSQFLSQHMGTISYLFWPVLMSIFLTFGKWRFLFMVAFALLTVYSVLNSINETAIVALTSGFLALALALIFPRITLVLAAIAYTILIFAIVPLSYLAYDILQLQLNSYIPASGQARFAVWYNVASFVYERVFIGHGVVHLQALLDSGRENWIMEHAHSHNVFLQTWYETGLFGALGLLVIGLSFLKCLYNLPKNAICFGIAGFVTLTVSMTTTAWELWVPWHIGLITLVFQVSTLLHRVVLNYRSQQSVSVLL